MLHNKSIGYKQDTCVCTWYTSLLCSKQFLEVKSRQNKPGLYSFYCTTLWLCFCRVKVSDNYPGARLALEFDFCPMSASKSLLSEKNGKVSLSRSFSFSQVICLCYLICVAFHLHLSLLLSKFIAFLLLFKWWMFTTRGSLKLCHAFKRLWHLNWFNRESTFMFMFMRKCIEINLLVLSMKSLPSD